MAKSVFVVEFLKEFLKRVGELQPQDRTNNVGQEVYNQTLAKHHPWLVKKGAVVAMYVLPTRDVLLQRVSNYSHLYYIF